MSTENWKFDKDLCRCCHTEGNHESLYTSLNWMGTEEFVYADMLRECYDIELAPVRIPPQKQVCTICETCIEKLHQALQFKRQVQTCEIRLREIIMKEIGKDAGFLVEVKEELPDPEDNDDEKPAIDCDKILIKVDRDSGPDETAHDEADSGDDRGLSDFGTDVDFKTEASDDTTSIRRSGRKKYNSKLIIGQKNSIKKVKISSTKVKKKKKVRNKTLQPSEEKEDNEDASEGVIKVVKPVQIQEDKDYKQVGNLFQCCRCEKIYKCKQYLRRHIRHLHLNVPKFPCVHCPKTFLTDVALTQHKLEEHKVDDRVQCSACNKIFNSKVQLRRHIACYHMLGVKYKCSDCDYVCFCVQYLRKHKLTHKTVKEYHCRFCRKSFMRRTTLAFHERIHTGDKRKVCKECGEAFVQKASLNYHMAKYHPGVDF